MSKSILAASAVFVLLFTVVWSGCGGGGGGGGGGVTPAGTTGSVAVLIADGPADEIRNLFLRVTEISLLSEGGRSPVVLFQSDTGIDLDLLDFRDEEYLLTVKRRVPVGTYTKVRLRVLTVRAEGGECQDLQIKLPSGKLDLNPRSTFDVRHGETVTVRLDVDANKSVQLRRAGRSGRCIFRPVVFVDIDTLRARDLCPRTVRGTVVDLVRSDDDSIDPRTDDDDGTQGIVTGFTIELMHGRGELDVELDENTSVFDADGLPTAAGAIRIGDEVRVRGRLDEDGNLVASVVALGELTRLRGEITSPLVNGRFTVQPAASEEEQDPVSVELFEETLILTGCDTPVGVENLKPGVQVRIFGFRDATSGALRATVVFVNGAELRGELVRVDPGQDGAVSLVVKPAPTENNDNPGQITILVPADVKLLLEGDGEWETELLARLVACDPREVRVMLDPEHLHRALGVFVAAEVVEGAATEVDVAARILQVGETRVQVLEGATVLDVAENRLLTLDALSAGDDITAFGLQDCDSEGIGFFASVVLRN